MAVPKTIKTYNLTGSLRDFEIPFEYLARRFIVVTLIGTDRRELELNTDYRFTSATEINTNVAWGPGAGYDMIEIRRFTSATDRLVEFSDGSLLKAYDLNISSIQSLHIAEEARDLTADTISVNADGHLDARGRKVVNVADAVAPGDAVNLRVVTEWSASALNSAIASQQSASASASASTSSQTARDQSIAARDASEAAQAASEAARDAAVVAKDTTLANVGTATTKANEASASASASATARDQSIAARDTATSQAQVATSAAASVTASAAQITTNKNALEAIANQSDNAKGTAGVGYRGRNLYSRLQDSPVLGDYSDLNAGLAAINTGNRTLVDPTGVSYKSNFNLQLAMFTETGDPAWMGAEVFRSSSPPGHIGVSRVARSIEYTPYGSGANGPTNSDYGMSISVKKQNWFGTTLTGEIDGLNIVVRQGGRMTGGVASDCAAILMNTGVVHGSGWAAGIESQTSTFSPTDASVINQVQTAMGVLDSVSSNYHGFTATANMGSNGAAFLANNVMNSTWARFVQLNGPSGQDVFNVNGSGWINLYAPSGANPRKTIRALNGSLNILNDAQTVQILDLSNAGALNVVDSVTAPRLVAKGAATAGAVGDLVIGSTISTTSSGGGVAMPTMIGGFLVWNINGTTIKIPFCQN